jgi:hypothetical protein
MHGFVNPTGDSSPVGNESSSNREIQMAKVLNQLVILMKGAKAVDTCDIKGPDNTVTRVWELSDGASIVMRGQFREERRSKSQFVCDEVDRVEKPAGKIISSLKRQRTLALKKQQGALI